MTVRRHNAAAAAGKHARWQKPESMLSSGHAPHFKTACGQEAGSQCVFSRCSCILIVYWHVQKIVSWQDIAA